MEYNFRTLNYLGSKFRLLDFIEENILKVTKEGEGVCDLFAGSGCVSYKLSLSSWLRQRPDHYTIRAGRNLPDKEFRYLRTVIVTAAVYRGFNSLLLLADDSSS